MKNDDLDSIFWVDAIEVGFSDTRDLKTEGKLDHKDIESVFGKSESISLALVIHYKSGAATLHGYVDHIQTFPSYSKALAEIKRFFGHDIHQISKNVIVPREKMRQKFKTTKNWGVIPPKIDDQIKLKALENLKCLN